MAIERNSDVHKYGWFTKQQLCELFACTPTHFDANFKQKIPPKFVDRTGSAHLFYGRAALEAWAITRVRISQKAKEAAGIENMDVEILDLNSSSKALEQLRQEKYKIARIERIQLQRSLVPKKRVLEGLGKLASILRDSGDRIGKISPRCLDILNECLEQFAHEVKTLENSFNVESK